MGLGDTAQEGKQKVDSKTNFNTRQFVFGILSNSYSLANTNNFFVTLCDITVK